ncbi:type VI secretion system protein TssA [Cronobacter malonaticus]|uniref:type VI secretion system protein TssA n=1 Tax=Cronobacter malonaticus TaxID=413503 RepID=UPI000CFB87E6|nr:type VI secretion system protein TssA [Cronobacter malonaticus]EKY3232787.1 type VI secretion system protein TssA [Cronobacter malonaticus]EKY3234098.1 type VI secretion system protein TssA [Cronobacter malonaticus]ELY4025391.1 type VI secretion system protein TssA [Cronobacter malonaticus]MDI7683842.1 type VI secretion system protein TssA [Cronobacter malonaticus]
MASLQTVIESCQTQKDELAAQAQARLALWEKWLQPVIATAPTGNDPGYDDDFQQIREEVNKLSGADTTLIGELAEKVLTTASKDIRVATYYAWARLHRDGEAGFAEGLELLAALLARFGTSLHPQRARSRQAALEWLAGTRVLDSLSLYPEVTRDDARRTAGALLLIEKALAQEEPAARPSLIALYGALEARLMKAGGVDAVVPQTTSDSSATPPEAAPVISAITSGRDLLDQARQLADYLRNQPDGWLAAHRMMKSLRHDTLHQLPPLAGDGRTRIEPPKADQRALLKRLWLQQSWLELLEQADSLFARGACHLWLDLQWYLHEALQKSGKETLAGIIRADLNGLLNRLPGLETLAFSDGTPFADEVTQHWIAQQVRETTSGPGSAHVVDAGSADDEVLQLEPEAVALADSDGIDAALGWLQTRPALTTPRQRWLQRLLMARLAEQYGKNDLALHLLAALDAGASQMTLSQWEPALLFEVGARRLRLLRMKAGRSDAEKARLQTDMEHLLARLIAIDPARAAVLCS